MTYEEAYRNINTINELIATTKRDLCIALLISNDRVEAIMEALNIVCEEKGWKDKFTLILK